MISLASNPSDHSLCEFILCLNAHMHKSFDNTPHETLN